MEGIQGKSFIVTGGGSGIGRATAVMLGQFGAQVTVADVNPQSAKAVAAEIEAAGGKAVDIATDVADEAQVKEMVAKATATFGRLDGGANCAGVPGHFAPVAEMTLADWNKVIAVNLTGAFLCVKYQAAAMLAANCPGSIVVISSAAAWRAYNSLAPYSATKAGIGGLVRSAAADLGPRGIRVNAVLPGRVDTAMYSSYEINIESLEKPVVLGQLLKEMGKPSELAGAIVWLLSDHSSFVTGAEVPVDGGLTIG